MDSYINTKYKNFISRYPSLNLTDDDIESLKTDINAGYYEYIIETAKKIGLNKELFWEFIHSMIVTFNLKTASDKSLNIAYNCLYEFKTLDDKINYIFGLDVLNELSNSDLHFLLNEEERELIRLSPNIVKRILEDGTYSYNFDITSDILHCIKYYNYKGLRDIAVKLGLDKNINEFNDFFDCSRWKYVYKGRPYLGTLEVVYIVKANLFDIPINDRVIFFLRCIKCGLFRHDLYEFMFNNKERESIKTFEEFLKHNHFQRELIPYLSENDRKILLDKYYVRLYKSCKQYLTEEEYQHVIDRILTTNEAFLCYHQDLYGSPIRARMIRSNSNLIDKLMDKYGEDYVKKTGLDLSDDETFILRILKSNVLEQYLFSPDINNGDLIAIRSILEYFEENGTDVSQIRERMDQARKELINREKYLYTTIYKLKDNDNDLEEFLKTQKINKNNYFNVISTKKTIDKKIKESILLILSKHYKTNNYIKVSDIIDMIQEAHDRELTLDDILLEREIDKKYFYNVYNKLKEEQPEIYDIINHTLTNVSKKDKKIKKIYYSIKNNKITDYNSFIKKYKHTPEEILELFEETPLFDEIHEYFLSWYDFEKGLPEIKEENDIEYRKR